MSIIIIIIFIINKLYLLLLNLFHIWKNPKEEWTVQNLRSTLNQLQFQSGKQFLLPSIFIS